MLISKFSAKVDVNQTTVTLIFRNLKDDERDQDKEKKSFPNDQVQGWIRKQWKPEKIGGTTSEFYFSRTYVRWSTLPADYHQLST